MLDPEPLQEFLGELAGEGQYQDSGRFLLDPKLALAKMGALQLADPYEWVLKLAQAATLLGCCRLEYEDRSRFLILRLVGVSLSAEELQAALRLVDDESDRSRGLRHLGAAVATCQALPHVAIRLGLQEGREAAVWDSRREQWLQLQTKQAAEAPLLFLHMERRRSWFRHSWPELEMLRRRCQMSPFPVHVNGVAQPRRFGPSWKAAGSQRSVGFYCPAQPGSPSRYFDCPAGFLPAQVWIQSDPRAVCRGPVLDEADERTVVYSSRAWADLGESPLPPQSSRALGAVLGVRADPSGSGRVQVLFDGVQSQPVYLPTCPGVEVVVSGDSLKSDLSGLRVNENEALQAILQRVAMMAEWLAVRLSTRRGAMSLEVAMAQIIMRDPSAVPMSKATALMMDAAQRRQDRKEQDYFLSFLHRVD